MRWWLKARVHSSWVVALGCAGFVAGVFISLFFRLPWVAGIGCGLGAIVCLGLSRVYALPVILICSTVVGAAYGSLHLGGRDQYGVYIGSAATIQGHIKEDPSTSASGSKSFQLDDVIIDGRSLTGTILVTARGINEALRGDILLVEGRIREGFGSFPASVTVTKLVSVVRPVPGDIGRVSRDWFADKIRAVIPEPQASLGIGFLTGQKSALSEELSEALKIAGLTHIVVASGYNLTILVRLARRLFLKVSKFLSAVSSGIMITLFMAITGLSPSMTRAGLVSGLSLMAWYYGHKFHPFVLLPFAAAITVAMQPSYVWGDLGWQLSFTAFMGVMLVAPLLQAYFFGKKEPSVLRQILGETVAAHAVTVPIIALSFGTVSNVAIIANLLVVPLVPLAMLLTFISGVLSVCSFPFVWIVATPTEWLLRYMTSVATFVAELDWAQVQVELPGWLWAVYAALLFGVCLWMWRVTKLDFRGSDPLVS